MNSYEQAVRENLTFYYREFPCTKCGGELFYRTSRSCVKCRCKSKAVLRRHYREAFVPVTAELLLFIINNPTIRCYEKIARIMGVSKASVKRAMLELNIPQRANSTKAFRRLGYRG